MINWWNSLQLIQQIFALIAIPSTLILVIQTVMLLIGLGHDSDADGDGIPDDLSTDADGDGVPDGDTDGDGIADSPDSGLALFTVRGILSMLCIAGWVGVALLDTAMPQWLAVLIAVLSGVVTLVAIAFAMKQASRLRSNGNIDVGNCIGKEAQVYIPIPPRGEGVGKVNVTVQEKFCEFSAITTSGEKLRTGTFVRVTSVSESGLLVVEPLTASK